MQNKFLSGLLTGILGALLVCILFFSFFLRGTGRQLDSNSGMPPITNGITDGLSEEDEILFQNKRMQIRGLINNYYYEDVEEKDLYDGMYQGMLNSLGDPYSVYYTGEEYAAMLESSSGIYSGIGALVSQNIKSKEAIVSKVFENAPAAEAGMLPDDIIKIIDDVDVTSLELNEVVRRMKGLEGTEVVVKVQREQSSELIPLKITRRKIEVPTVEFEMLKDEIGYISVLEFDEVTVAQFENAINKLEEQGMKGLIVDLRDNPGGLYTSVIAMLDRMLPKGLLVYTEDKSGMKDERYAVDDEEFTLPLAVLVNGYSASASEIFAGAIQDYKKGTIVGTQSYGKGIVQSIFPLESDNTAIKLTVSAYYTPNGRNIHGTGITPDVEVELNEELKKKPTVLKEEDNQLQEAIRVVKEK